MKFSDTTAAGVATASGLGGVIAAACCCVLPLALAGVGVGATGLARFGPLHAPLSAIALVAVIGGWFLHSRRKRACAAGMDCAPSSPVTLSLLIAASALVALSASWPFIEAPLMNMLGG
jgi:mercuric ion transport protein